MIKKFDLSDIHNLARLENKFWCFGGDGGGGAGGGGDSSADDADSMDSGTGPGNAGFGGGPSGGFGGGFGDVSPGYGGPSGPTGGIDTDATFDGFSDFDPGFGMGVDLGSAFGGAFGYAGVDEGQPTNMAGYVDQGNREGFSIAGVPGINAAEARDAINEALAEGRIGYNAAVDLGFPSLIDQAEKDFDLATAISIENKYGLERGQVTPGFGSFSYQGPNAIAAAMSEIGSAARSLTTAYSDMLSEMPSLTGTIAGVLGFEGVPGSVLGTGFRSDVLGLEPESEIGKNISDVTEALGLSSIPSSIDEAALGIAQAIAEEATGFDLSSAAIAEGLFDSVFGTEEEEENAFTGFETTDVGLSSNLGSPSASVADIGSQAESPEESIDPGGDEFISRPQPIPSPPQIASLPAQNIFREPITRTAAADTFSILSKIYGPEVARQLAPNRTV
jgi:hypothetical protein